MGSIKQKNRARRRKKQVQQHRRSMLGISAVILLLAVIVSVSSIELRAKNSAYIEQEQELEEEIQAEKDRAEEIDDLEEYVGTDEYVEQTAKDKLGLVHEITLEPIAAQERRKQQEAYAEVLPDAESFEELDLSSDGLS